MMRQSILIGLLSLGLVCTPTSAAEEELSRAAQLQQDFEQLYRDLQRGSYDLFAHTSKSTFDVHFASAMRQINEDMSDLDAHKLFMKFTALADIGHTRIDFPIASFREFAAAGGQTLPIEFYIQDGELFVEQYLGSLDISTHDQLISVDQVPARQWLNTLQQYIAADNRDLADVLIQGGIPPYAWLHDGEVESYTLTFKSSESGQVYTVEQPTLTHEQQTSNTDEAPEIDAEPRSYEVLGNGIGYLKPGPFYNVFAENNDDVWNTEQFFEFIDQAFTAFIAADVEDIVIDVRDNPGGTNSFSDHLISWFADRPYRFASEFRVKVSSLSREANAQRLVNDNDPSSVSSQLEAFYSQNNEGDVILFPLIDSEPHEAPRNLADSNIRFYVWIDKYSFSNAVSVAAIAKDYEFATVIGEKTADLATTYAAMEFFTLEHTGFQVGYPKALIVRPNGDTQADGVAPEIRLECPSGSTPAAFECLSNFVLQQRTHM